MTGPVLALNAGSSSVKFAVFQPGDAPHAKLRGEIEDIAAAPHLLALDAAGVVLAERRWPSDRVPSFTDLIDALLGVVDAHLGPDELIAVGHRVVHGGPDLSAPALVTPALLVALEALTPFDPMHMPHSLAPIRAISAARPGLAQIACFDTAFHQTMPLVATQFAIPRALSAAGVRRYGFHGLSYEYIASQLKRHAPALSRGRVVVAHLGSGASLCALLAGQSIATTMGFSVLDGLVMATRCGNLDPGVVLYLGRLGHSFADIETLLYEDSGLLGVSGISGDLRVLIASDDPRAAEAIDLFTYRIGTESGALVSALGGLDGLVFTAGIGQNASAIRAGICARLAWLGVRLDETANTAGLAVISTADSKVEVRVIAANEEAMIASHALARLLSDA
ncbi:acetate/propionate family kinase [Phenylobacterium sp.]|uniref:acetate/propionate family kinase n=1 Tax=Phenylobacterium sp. TaxID=1871053 RepID=UPI00120D8A5B|nr:acetate/propionate family kinase [Phenylobacterium sp.]THD60150.1 MAG: acetate/propionate family kinase [Phenylobacterium sp.]